MPFSHLGRVGGMKGVGGRVVCDPSNGINAYVTCLHREIICDISIYPIRHKDWETRENKNLNAMYEIDKKS